MLLYVILSSGVNSPHPLGRSRGIVYVAHPVGVTFACPAIVPTAYPFVTLFAIELFDMAEAVKLQYIKIIRYVCFIVFTNLNDPVLLSVVTLSTYMPCFN